ncbi:MAG: hypothetical protein QW674_01750 [Candidatus Bathyarchaeia archaeon]
MEKPIGLFNSIFRKLDHMEKTQKVDISILKDFELAEKQLSEFEKECIEAKERKIEDAFLFFHVMRSSRMILEKMRHRFSEAEAKHENPVIVDLSKMVVPRLNELYAMVLPLFSNNQHVLSESERGAILRAT